MPILAGEWVHAAEWKVLWVSAAAVLIPPKVAQIAIPAAFLRVAVAILAATDAPLATTSTHPASASFLTPCMLVPNGQTQWHGTKRLGCRLEAFHGTRKSLPGWI